MSKAAQGLKEQLYQHYYTLTKNAAEFLRSPEKQAEADSIMRQIEAINAGQKASVKKSNALAGVLQHLGAYGGLNAMGSAPPLAQLPSDAAAATAAAAAAVSPLEGKEAILMSLFDSYVRFSRFPDSEYKEMMKKQVQEAYDKQNPGINLEDVYQKLVGKKAGGRRRKARKTRKNRA